MRPGRWIATLLETCAALASLVSIDMLSTRWISTPVLALLERFTQDYSALSGVEAGVRMTSIFENPNVFAGCVGIAVLLSLGLIQSSKTNWEKRIHQVLLFLQCPGFRAWPSAWGQPGPSPSLSWPFWRLEQEGETG